MNLAVNDWGGFNSYDEGNSYRTTTVARALMRVRYPVDDNIEMQLNASAGLDTRSASGKRTFGFVNSYHPHKNLVYQANNNPSAVSETYRLNGATGSVITPAGTFTQPNAHFEPSRKLLALIFMAEPANQMTARFKFD